MKPYYVALAALLALSACGSGGNPFDDTEETEDGDDTGDTGDAIDSDRVVPPGTESRLRLSAFSAANPPAPKTPIPGMAMPKASATIPKTTRSA